MKHMKKFMALFAALALVMAMAVPAFADDPAPAAVNSNDGSITIGKAVKDETYDIYEIFKLDSYSGNNYSYSVKSEWKSFFEGSNPGTTYITLDTHGQPEWVNSKNDEETAAAFAQAALTWAKQNGIHRTDSKIAAGTTVEFNNLELGYYLVDTSLGALCNLTTTAKNAQIEEKNDTPDIEKEIKEGEQLVKNNTAKIGDVVNYEVTVTVQKGTEGYIVRDKMDDGLTFNDDVVVSVGGSTISKEGHYEKVSMSGYTFALKFEDSYIQTLTADTKIKINYSATINENAAIGDHGNKNKVNLKYGNASETIDHEVETKVYEFDLVKVDGTTKQLLAGAKFKLYDAQTGGNEIRLVKLPNGSYRVAKSDEATVDFIETTATGSVRISGLKGTTYWLEETAAPDGYNKLLNRAEANLTTGSNVTTMTGNTWAAGNGGVLVENNAGTTLPGTGGIGTTIFYVVGGGLMVAAAVLLVAKKRMENK